MEIEVIHIHSGKTLAVLSQLPTTTTIYNIKEEIHKISKQHYPERQSLRLDPAGKDLGNDIILVSLSLKDGRLLFFKDLGPQIGWKTVFLVEYAGPLALYGLTYARPNFLYGQGASLVPKHHMTRIAFACWSGHYIKRIMETLFVHRFSHSTMPIFNLFKNCGYYWTFGLIIGYFINHPKASPPLYGDAQIMLALFGFLICEAGNLSIHLALRKLRPPGTKEVKIPMPGSNPFTWLFSYVSCPNYTYEICSWFFFSMMTQSIPCYLFMVAGFYQMAEWAKKKQINYWKMFRNYPRKRKALVPLLL